MLAIQVPYYHHSVFFSYSGDCNKPAHLLRLFICTHYTFQTDMRYLLLAEVSCQAMVDDYPVLQDLPLVTQKV